jgi:2-phosphosulfolactate phosphatase
MLACSFVVAGETVRHIQQLQPERVPFVITGGRTNDEDLACAEYLQALLEGQLPDPRPFIKRVYDSRDAQSHLDPARPEFPASDLDLCTQIDRFPFSMPIRRENGTPVMRAVQI